MLSTRESKQNPAESLQRLKQLVSRHCRKPTAVLDVSSAKRGSKDAQKRILAWECAAQERAKALQGELGLEPRSHNSISSLAGQPDNSMSAPPSRFEVVKSVLWRKRSTNKRCQSSNQPSFYDVTPLPGHRRDCPKIVQFDETDLHVYSLGPAETESA